LTPAFTEAPRSFGVEHFSFEEKGPTKDALYQAELRRPKLSLRTHGLNRGERILEY